MRSHTTKESAKLVHRELSERSRQLSLVVLLNESGTVQVEATTDEVDDFERAGNRAVESDVISDELMDALVAYLEREALLE
jgi:hypothetical protein